MRHFLILTNSTYYIIKPEGMKLLKNGINPEN